MDRRLLTPDEVAQRMGALPGWRFENHKLIREYKFADFRSAFAFMTTCALFAEKMDHHPDWSNTYNRVVIELTTHDRGGVTELDLTMAREMEAAAGRFQAG